MSLSAPGVEPDAGCACQLLEDHGVRITRQVPPVIVDAKLIVDTDRIAAMFRTDIERLQLRLHRRSFDVVNARNFRSRAINYREYHLSEHVHEEHEIRWFLSGSLLLYVNLDGRVSMTRCRAGDLVAVAPGVRHWIDMGPDPDYCCVNFYNSRDRLVNRYTGSCVAESVPRWESVMPPL
jgi:1,2-dihydroxy-3-keto-5-methylthiopentene dioxygenase